jgi:hypothetical protein
MTEPIETQAPPGVEDGWLLMDEYDEVFDGEDPDA